MSKGNLAGIIIVCITVIVVVILVTRPSGPVPTPEADPMYTLSVSVDPSEAGSVSPPGGRYESGVQVALTASPASGYSFDYWSGSASGTHPTITVIMDTDKSLTANFETTSPVSEVLFFDDFTDEAGPWYTFSDENGTVFYENGWLHLVNYTLAPVVTHTRAYQHFTDFILEVDTKLVAGTDDNWHSVALRYQDDDNYYTAGVSADGYYAIAKHVHGDLIDLVEPAYSGHIRRGSNVINSIRIECVGSSVKLSVNGHLLTTVTDATFSGGDIALVATSLAGGSTEIAFGSLVVTRP